MSNILFSVIIPTFKRNDLLLLCLNSILKANENINLNIEVIVTSDSFEETLQVQNLFPESNVLFVSGPGKGPAANRNNGVQFTKGEWILFLDDDVVADSSILSAYLNAIHYHPSIKAFEGSIYPDDWKLLEKDMAECPVNISGGCFWSANVCIKKELFLKIGGFDEQFTIAAQEDQDIYQRLKQYSKVPFLKDAFVTHPVRIASLKTKIKSASASITNWLKFEHKNNSLINCFYIGYKTQVLAFIENMRKRKLKSTICNMYIMLVFPFIVLISKINRNV